MKLEELEVLISANADQFRSEFLTIQSQLNKVDAGMKKNAGGITKSFGGMKIAAIASITAIIAGTVKLITATSKLSMNAIESENLVAVTFGNLTGEITDWSNKLESALGLNAYTLRKNAGIFFNIANSLGVTRDNALELSKGMVSLAGDMSSFYNLTDDESFTKLRAGITGETEPLKQLGIIVDETTIKQTAYRLGIAETGRELSNSQKVMARYMTIMEQTKNAQGDLARTVDSPANQLRILKSRVETLGIALGNFFIPIINAVLPYINAFVQYIMSAVRSVGALFGIMGATQGKDTAKTGDKIASSFSSADNAIQGASGSAKQLKKDLLGLAGFDEMNVLSKKDSSGGSGGASGIGADTGFVIPEYDMGLDDMEEKTKAFTEKIKEFFAPLGEVFEPVVKLWNAWVKPALEGLWALIKELWASIIDSPVGEILKTIAQILGVIIVIAIGVVINAITGLVAIIKWQFEQWKKGFDQTVELIANLIVFFSNFGENVKKIWEDVKAWIFQKLVEIGLWVFKKISEIIAYWNLIKAVAIAVFQYAVDFVRGKIENIKSFFVGLYNSVASIFTSIKNAIWNAIAGVIDKIQNKVEAIKGFFSTIASGIVSVIKTPINKMIDLINNFIRSLNKIKLPEWTGLGNVGFAIGEVPKLATGGSIKSPTLAMMGEGNYEEAVLPLDRNTGWAEKVAKLINENRGSDGGNMNLVVKLGEKKIYEGFIDFVNDKSLATNSKLLNI